MWNTGSLQGPQKTIYGIRLCLLVCFIEITVFILVMYMYVLAHICAGSKRGFDILSGTLAIDRQSSLKHLTKHRHKITLFKVFSRARIPLSCSWVQTYDLMLTLSLDLEQRSFQLRHRTWHNRNNDEDRKDCAITWESLSVKHACQICPQSLIVQKICWF